MTYQRTMLFVLSATCAAATLSEANANGVRWIFQAGKWVAEQCVSKTICTGGAAAAVGGVIGRNAGGGPAVAAPAPAPKLAPDHLRSLERGGTLGQPARPNQLPSAGSGGSIFGMPPANPSRPYNPYLGTQPSQPLQPRLDWPNAQQPPAYRPPAQQRPAYQPPPAALPNTNLVKLTSCLAYFAPANSQYADIVFKKVKICTALGNGREAAYRNGLRQCGGTGLAFSHVFCM